MKSQSLLHDHAFALATAILDMVAPCLREEEKREAFEMFYTAAKAAFESYETCADRMERRVRPSKN
jgi:hypothetical protein